LVLSTKRFVAEAKFLVAATKIYFIVPNFVAVTKSFFFHGTEAALLQRGPLFPNYFSSDRCISKKKNPFDGAFPKFSCK